MTIANGFGTVAMLSVLIALPAQSAAPPFDKPLKTVRIPLPRDPDNPQARSRLSCFYFPQFMVKEIDLGEVGADQLSIIPAPGGSSSLACRRENIPSEQVIAARDWSGYFEGAKGGYAIFDAEDGWNGGVGFAVYDARTGKKLFDDAFKTRLRSLEVDLSGLTMRYLRVFAAKCSLAADAAGCWGQIMQQTSLSAAAPPDCAALYAREAKRTPKFAARVRTDPTIVDYDVRVVIRAGVATITPVSTKAAACRPSD